MRNLCIFFVFFTVQRVFAQAPNDFAESFFFYPANISMLIPAYAGIDHDLSGNVAYRSYTGQLSALRTYLGMADYNFRKRENKDRVLSKHMGGLGFYNEREGDFFNRARLLSRYAFHLPLSDRWYLSAGASFHLINYQFRASSAGSQGSDLGWSGNIGAAVYAENFQAGFSVNDFNNPRLRPVNYTFVLYRYLTLHAAKYFVTGSRLKIPVSVRLNLVPEGRSTTSFQSGLLFSERIGMNVFVQPKGGWGWAIDIRRIELNKGMADLSLAYRFPFAGRYPPNNQFEFNFRYYMNREKEE